jgi:hypothetical protein
MTHVAVRVLPLEARDHQRQGQPLLALRAEPGRSPVCEVSASARHQMQRIRAEEILGERLFHGGGESHNGVDQGQIVLRRNTAQVEQHPVIFHSSRNGLRSGKELSG